MGPKQITVRTTLTPEVTRLQESLKISTSQEAPTLRPTPERHAAPRGRAHETQKTNTPLRSNRTKSCSAPSPDSNKVQPRIASPSTETKTRDYREQIATLANSPYNFMTTSPYVPLGSLGQHHEALNDKHASSENTTDLLQISRLQEHDNTSTPVTPTRELLRGSISSADHTREYEIPEVSATPKTPPPPPGPDLVHITMADIQAIMTKTARDIKDDLKKQENEEQTDAVKNLQIRFNEQQVKSKKATVKDKPDKTTGQTQQGSIHSTCIRTNQNCETENTMVTQTKRNQPSKDHEMHKLYEDMQELQRRFERLQQTNNASTTPTEVDTPRAQRQHNVTHTQTRSPSTTATESHKVPTQNVITDNDKRTNENSQWQPPEDGVIQSHRGATATVSINRFENLYNTEENDHENNNIRWVLRWVPQLYIRNELLEYQRRHLKKCTANTRDTRTQHTPTSTTMSKLLTKPRRGQAPRHRKADTAQTHGTLHSWTNKPTSKSPTEPTNKSFTRKQDGPTTHNPTNGNTNADELSSMDDNNSTEQDTTNEGDNDEDHNSSTETSTKVPTLQTNTKRSIRERPQAHTWTPPKLRSGILPRQGDGTSSTDKTVEYTSTTISTSCNRNANITSIATTDPSKTATTATNSTNMSSTELDTATTDSHRDTNDNTSWNKGLSTSSNRTPPQQEALRTQNLHDGKDSDDSTNRAQTYCMIRPRTIG